MRWVSWWTLRTPLIGLQITVVSDLLEHQFSTRPNLGLSTSGGTCKQPHWQSHPEYRHPGPVSVRHHDTGQLLLTGITSYKLQIGE